MINGIERDFRYKLESLAQPIVAVDALPIGRPRSRMLNSVLRYGAEVGNVLAKLGVRMHEMGDYHFVCCAGDVRGQGRRFAVAAAVP
jgi:hypothetical protein